MSSTQLSPKRFRIERLEERISPGILFWADDLSVNALTQWAVIEASDPPQPAAEMVARSQALERATLSDASQTLTSKPGRIQFPVWAERILQEVESELNGRAQSKHVPQGITAGVTFFSDVMNTSSRTVAKDEDFPVWAQELLADLDQRPAHEAVPQSTAEFNANLPADQVDGSSTFVPPKCEISRFPAWAEELLSAVDRRIEYDARSEAVGAGAVLPSQSIEELIRLRLP